MLYFCLGVDQQAGTAVNAVLLPAVKLNLHSLCCTFFIQQFGKTTWTRHEDPTLLSFSWSITTATQATKN